VAALAVGFAGLTVNGGAKPTEKYLGLAGE